MNESALIRRRQWKEKVDSWQSSGKTIAAWCKENNISYNTFQNWRKQLGLTPKKNTTTSPSFIELKEENSHDSGVQLQLKGISVSLSENFDEKTLISCLRVLRGL